MLSASASQALLQVLVGKPRSPGALMLLQEHGAGGCDVQHGDENMEVAKNTGQWSCVSWHLPPSRIMQTSCTYTEHIWHEVTPWLVPAAADRHRWSIFRTLNQTLHPPCPCATNSEFLSAASTVFHPSYSPGQQKRCVFLHLPKSISQPRHCWMWILPTP